MGKHLFMRTVTAGLVVASLGGVAAASPFVLLDRQDGNSSLGGELVYDKLDNDLDGTLMSFNFHGQYVSPAGAGGYLVVPMAYSDGDNSNSVTAVGDIELGGIYNIKTATELAIVLHGGLTLPTASDDAENVYTGIYSSFLRVHDLYQWIPKGTSLRLGASPTFKSGKMFLRGDAGVDLNLDSADGTDPDTVFHIGGGIGGWVSPEFALMGELMITDTGDNLARNLDNLTNVAFSGRYQAGSVGPYFSLVVPLDNDVSDAIDFGIVLGLDAAL